MKGIGTFDSSKTIGFCRKAAFYSVAISGLLIGEAAEGFWHIDGNKAFLEPAFVVSDSWEGVGKLQSRSEASY
jgi:hypothetical protein